MKNRISILLAVIYTFFSFNFVYANDIDNNMLSQARTEAESKIDIPKDYTSFTSYVNIKADSTNYIFSWSKETSKVSDGGYITATLDSKFRIIKFSQYKYGRFESDYKLASVDYNEAALKTISALNTLVPEFMANVKIHNYNNFIGKNGRKYNYVFYRYENGIPYYDNYISASFDPETMQLFEFDVKWEDFLKISPNTYKIPEITAMQKYISNIGIEQEYYNTFNGVSIRYALNENGKDFINAYNGEILHTDLSLSKSTANYDRIPKITDKQYNFINSESLFTHYESYIRGISALNITKSYNLTKSEVMVDDYANKYLKYTFSNSAGRSICVTIDTNTKTICEVSSDKIYYDIVKPLSDEKCYKIAVDFCKKYIRDTFNECKPSKGVSLIDKPDYQVRFTRIVNGIPYNNNSILVTIDRATGKIIGFNVDWNTYIDFPSPANTITESMAYETFASKIGFGTFYTAVRTSKGNELRLVYGFLPSVPVYVDAFSNEPVTKTGETYGNENSGECIDIAGHKDRECINTLLLAGIAKADTYFYPDEYITQTEYLSWCFRALDIAQECDYSYLLNKNIISEEEIAPQLPVTKEDAIKYLICMLGYSDVGKLQDTYVTPYVDGNMINENLKGYAAIAYGMGIINGNAFMPQENLTKAVAAEIIYNLISKQEM